MWDWIRGALGMDGPRPAEEPESTEPMASSSGSESSETDAPAPASPTPVGKRTGPRRKTKRSRRPTDDGTKRPKKPNRKKRKQPPGWSKEDREEGGAPRIHTRVIVEAERPVSLLPPDEDPTPEQDVPTAAPPPPPAARNRSDESTETPSASANTAATNQRVERPPSPTSERTERPSPRQRDQAMVAWIVVPKLEALLEELDAAMAIPDADRDRLTNARGRFVREWRALRPLPASDAERLNAAYDERLAAITQRIDATVDPRAEEEATNVAMRETMIEAARGLVELQDLKAAIRQAKALQKEWTSAPRVARDKARDQTRRFREAMDQVFARREREEAERLVKLEAFVESAQALSRSEDPERAAEAMKRLQSQWKETGGVRGEKGDDVWTRFRAAADQVFERRQLKRQEMHAQSVQARQSIIEEAEGLADEGVEDPDSVIRDLQRRWRQTGHVPREEGDALWTAFKAACDRIRNPPAMDPSSLGDGQEGLSFNPFAGIDRDPS